MYHEYAAAIKMHEQYIRTMMLIFMTRYRYRIFMPTSVALAR